MSAARSLLHAVRCMLSVTRCLPHVVCHTLCAARCLLRVDAARCALHAVCCMVCAARFRPSHVSCIVSAVCCTLHAVFSCLPSVCVVRWMVRAGCCPLHECLLRVGCGSLRPASNARLPLHRLPPSAAPRHALRSGTERGVLHRTTAGGSRCAAHRMPPGSHLGDYSPEYCGSTIGCDCGVASRDCRRCSCTAHVPSHVQANRAVARSMLQMRAFTFCLQAANTGNPEPKISGGLAPHNRY